MDVAAAQKRSFLVPLLLQEQNNPKMLVGFEQAMLAHNWAVILLGGLMWSLSILLLKGISTT